MISVTDKWDSYVIDNQRGDGWAALDLVRERLEQGFWYFNFDDGDPQSQWRDRAEKIAETEDTHAALALLMERRDFEYEWVEVTKVRA